MGNGAHGNFETAVFGGGCFWCTEAVFKMLKGVLSVTPGYAGGPSASSTGSPQASSGQAPSAGSGQAPTYEQVCSGITGHAEVVKIEYDPGVVSFHDLLVVFFGSHDPTTRNRQGNDVGTQYRSVIFYTAPEQKETAERLIKEINESNAAGAPVVTEVALLNDFYEAEDYHKDYFAKNPYKPYCEIVINPKLEKVQQQFVELLGKNEKK